MSHVTSSLAVCQDLDILRKIIKEKFPKLVWKEGQTKYAWYNRFQDDWGKENETRTARARGIDPSQYGHCSHCIELLGCDYSIGVTERKDGQGYSLVWDVWHGQEISACIGQDAEKLMAEYSQEFISQFATTNGYMLNQSTDDEGSLCLELMR